MKYLDDFLAVFGNVTIAEVVTYALAFLALWMIYKELKKYNNSKISEYQKKVEIENAYKKKLDSAYDLVGKYTVYHQESIDIRDGLKKEIKEIRDGLTKEIKESREHFDVLMKRFEAIEEQNKKRECSKLRDMLLQNYRYYTNPCQNPSQSWTRMESEAFWELFREYEDAGGNGYMHTVVQPEMERLLIIEVGQQSTIQN